MRSEDIAILGFVTMGIGVLAAVVTRQQKVEQQRLQVIQAALQRPELDPALRQQLIDALAKRSRPSQLLAHLLTVRFWQKAMFAVGWMMFLVMGGAFLLGQLDLVRVPSDIAIGMLVGLALMSLPRALEELKLRGGRLAEPR